MESSRQPDSIVPATVVLLALLVGGYLGFQPPLNSSRPDGMDIKSAGTPEIGKVRARLWEDPFAAVLTSAKTVKRTNIPISETAAHRGLTVLFVMVPGGPYPEEGEQRLRTRYAVLSALDLAGYFPSDGQHISYASIQISYSSEKDNRKKSLVVPFEKFDSEKPNLKQKDSVLILWLEDESFSSGTLLKLGKLKEKLSSPSKSAAANVDFAMIGPTNSTVLGDMVREGCSSRKHGTALNKADVHSVSVPIYSSWATIDDKKVIDDLHKQHRTTANKMMSKCIDDIKRLGATEAIEKSLGPKWKLHRMNTTDLKLAESLKTELELRGVDLKDPKQHMVLISEWDTNYGRAMPEAFVNAICGPINEPASCKDRIRRFSYMRGLDGKLPGKSANGNHKGAEEKNGKKEEKAGFTGEVERPEGQSQFDYARRLGTRITELQRGLWKKGESVKAIGILGSDVHDKLLLLQALRNKFPGIIFFTTDLDTRLLHPAEIKWTRNLVVASGFGLHLHPEIQEAIPPFRDTYQTAAFYSVLKAVHYPKLENRVPAQDLTPRLYEIGRKGAVDLSINNSESCGYSLYPPREDLFAFFSCSRDFLDIWSTTIFLGAALLALAGLLVLRNGGQRACQVMWIGLFLLGLLFVISLGSGLRLMLLAIAVAAFSVAALHKKSGLLGVAALTVAMVGFLASWGNLPSYNWQNGEPFSVFDGVSIWPTEVIRFVVGLFCIYCLLSSWDQLDSNTRQLFDKYKEDLGLADARPTVTNWKQIFCASPASDLKNASAVSELWRFYAHQGSASCRAMRISRGIACLFLLAFFLQGFFGRPFVPYRGDFSYYVDRTVILLSGFSLIVLMYFVIDSLNLCTDFVRELKRLRWSSPDTGSKPLEAWATIRLIGDRTSAVGHLIYCPFIALFLLIASRLFYFDAWDFPLSLIIVLVVWLPLQLVVAALLLRRAAREVRSAALQQLGDKLWKAQPETANEIKEATARIESNHQGAFVPMSRDPVVSFILPSGSLCVLALLEYMVGIF